MTDDDILVELFHKFGLNDGGLPGCDDIQQRFSQHLKRHGFQSNRLTTHHNPRVSSILIGERWLRTESLSRVRPVWSLKDHESHQEFPISNQLEEAIRAFLPLAGGLIQLGSRLEVMELES